MEKCILPVGGLQTSATRHCRKTHWAFMMIPSQMAFQVKLFEYSVTTVTKRSTIWAYQPTPNSTLSLFRLPLFRQAITSLFQLLSSHELCYSLISAALLLCRAV